MAEQNPSTMQSENIGNLAKALALAIKAMKPPTKGRTATIKSEKGSYSYKYADLADVIESYRAPLSENGLSLVQPIQTQDGHLVLVTRLLHESGEWLSSEYPIANFTRPQEMGSALTYARRYAVTAMLGIAAEDDDDGERAGNAEPAKQTRKARTPEAEAPKPPADPMGKEDIQRVYEAGKLAGLDYKGLVEFAKDITGAATIADMDKGFMGDLLTALKLKADLKAGPKPPTQEEIEADVREVFGPGADDK